MDSAINRRHLLGVAGVGAIQFVGSSLALGNHPHHNSPHPPASTSTGSRMSQTVPTPDESNRVRYCLNTSTIREQGLDLKQEIELAAAIGYDGIEPWIREITAYEQNGGSIDDLGKLAADLGIRIESAIGFAQWIVDDDERRRDAIERAKADMELVRRLGGNRIAAPPAGATSEPGPELFVIAERYGALIRAGRDLGVVPLLELWGFSQTLSRLGELAFVASECGEPEAAVLPDVYHIYKGGSDFSGLNLFAADRIQVFHMNDYPAEPPRETIGDADRVYPGDGVAPLNDIFGTLISRGFQGVLSLELFNRTYWQEDAEVVARLGLEKMRSAMEQAANH